jgi:hypothetical protein
MLPGAVRLAGPLAVITGILAAATVPAGATSADAPFIAQNVAAGSYAPSGAATGGPNGLAASPPATTTVVNNVNINGLVSTGTTTGTADTTGAYAKVTNALASTSWTVGLTTYTFTVSAAQLTAVCTAVPLTAAAAITGGKLTETARTGAHVTSRIFNLPQLPAVGQAYPYNGGTVVLNDRVTFKSTTIAAAVGVHTPRQQLAIALTTCSPTIRVIGGP